MCIRDRSIELFVSQLDVDEEVAMILVQEGFASVEEVAYVPQDELLEIDEFDAEMVDELRSRANDALLTKAISGEGVPSEELVNMEGMNQTLANQMAAHGILTVDDLGEQSIDELMVVDDMDEELAGKLIMKARESWFAEAEGNSENSEAESAAEESPGVAKAEGS